jgi:enoyl-CoA hydratase
VPSAETDLLAERDGGILVLTMNRPARKNALSLEMLAGLADAWDLADTDPDIRCVVLTGSGSTYCVGGDLASGWMAPGYQPASDAERRIIEDPTIIAKALLLKHWCRKPVIAAVNGACLGGGCEMLQQTDIRVAEQHATFGLPEVRRGLMPGAGSTVRLKRQIPYAVAMEMLLTGRTLDAEEALRWGLVTHVVPTGEGLTRAREIATRIVANAPLAVAATKASAVETSWLTEDQAIPIEAVYAERIGRSRDAAEGMRAFVEKRPARYTGE